MLRRAVKLGLQGIGTGIEYHVKKSLDINQYPTFMIYQFTNNCNSRCMMCNIWKKKSEGELKTEDIEKLSRNRQFSGIRWINLTGGEPFMRDDIDTAVKHLSKLPSLEGIAIPSNGFLTKRIVEKAEKMLGHMKGKFLSITLSIDGFEKTHEKIRGVPGAYKKVTATLDGLLKLKKRYPNFNVGIQPTISKANLAEIPRFYREMKKKTKSIGFAVMLTSEGYYDNQNSEIALSREDKKKIARFFRKILKNDPQYGFYYTKLIDMFETGKRNFGCLAGYITLFMDPFGKISPCPVLSANKRYDFGNVNDNFWFTKKAARIKRQLKKERICESCSMMCDFINVAKVEFFEHAAFMAMHPEILYRLFKKIKKEKNPYF